MTTAKDFSEIQEAARLISDLLHPSPHEAVAGQPGAAQAVSHEALQVEANVEPAGFRGDRAEKALEIMCRRGGFVGAVIADDTGLPVAVFNSPVGANSLAAFTSVLGAALEKAARLLDQHEADNISMDINYTDKAVLRRFSVAGLKYYLMVICPQNADERGEIELSLEQIISILS